MLAVFLVPLRDGRVLVHVLDDLAPADTRVVRAEGNFALLRGVRDDAHFGAAEIVVEQILEPHARDQQEVPRIAVTRRFMASS
jgi:formylmethanofuran dehydrogenase subunit A